MRVLAVSDLHVDYDGNMRWVKNVSAHDHSRDVLILAGDVSDRIARLEAVFRHLRRCFAAVMFVPGNHELWVRRDGPRDSVQKYRDVQALAADCGLSSTPLRVDALRIVPMLGWYDDSFGVPCDRLAMYWADFYNCVWPDGMSSADVSRSFVEQNEPHIEPDDVFTISFSHFLPTLEVMPERVPEHERYVYAVLGTTLLGAQVTRLAPRIHVYGHSHVNNLVKKNGTVFVNNALGYPSEEHFTRRELLCIYPKSEQGYLR